uniref:protein-tyrosine-phosphatase n=1 Tax=Steinernema glaseri TaxID=37863 RepID=A0A1I7YMA7_9BILA
MRLNGRKVCVVHPRRSRGVTVDDVQSRLFESVSRATFTSFTFERFYRGNYRNQATQASRKCGEGPCGSVFPVILSKSAVQMAERELKRCKPSSDASNASDESPYPGTSPYRVGEDSVFLNENNLSTCSVEVIDIPLFRATAKPAARKQSKPLATLSENSLNRKRLRATSLYDEDERGGKKSKKDSMRLMSTGASLDCEYTVNYHLPAVAYPQVPSGAFRSIHDSTLADLVSTMTEEEFNSKYFLVDCRYGYEYTQGHIKYARNHFDPSGIEAIFFPPDETEAKRMRSLVPIFYCEFSQKRGPGMAHKLRECDRKRNAENYPYVEFPEIYLLDRGYNRFFSNPENQKLCEPRNYVKMDDPRYRDQLKTVSFHRSKSSSIKRSSYRSQDLPVRTLSFL